jgi:hypothetical protein
LLPTGRVVRLRPVGEERETEERMYKTKNDLPEASRTFVEAHLQAER